MAFSITATSLPEVRLVLPDRFGDDRGFFSETYSRRAFAAAGIADEFVQDNHSVSLQKGVVRGLHFQVPPHAQAKLVRVTRGSIFDVAVDIRLGSPTYGRHVGAVLSAAKWQQIWIPEGFAHGFCTLEPDTEVLYKVTDYYAPECDRGLNWDDPALAIAWPVAPHEVVLSTEGCAASAVGGLEKQFRHLDRKTWRRMRVLVTGGAGFIGSAVCRHLVGDLGAEVLNVDKLTYAANPRSLDPIAHDERYRFLRADICDRTAMEAAFDGFHPDAVLHLAAESHVDRSIDGPPPSSRPTSSAPTRCSRPRARYWSRAAGGRTGALPFPACLDR